MIYSTLTSFLGRIKRISVQLSIFGKAILGIEVWLR